MSQAGSVVEVLLQSRGSMLVGDHAAGVTTLLVDDPTPFDETGGQISINGVPYAYTAASEVPDTVDPSDTNGLLTLFGTGLLTALSDMTPVDLWNGSQILNDVILKVATGEQGDAPTPVTLKVEQRGLWEGLLGPVDPPIAVIVSDDLSTLEDAPGYSAAYGGYITGSLIRTAETGRRIEMSDQTLQFPNDPALIQSLRFYSGSDNEGLPAFFTNVVQPSLSDPAKEQLVFLLQGATGLTDPTDPSSTSPTPPFLAMFTDFGDMSVQVILGAGGSSVSISAAGVSIGGGHPIKGHDCGTFTGTTDSSGQVSIPHALSAVPVGVELTVAGGPAYLIVRRVSRSSSAVVAQCNNSTTGAALGAGVSVAIDWTFTA